jgi:cytochrome P450
MRRRNVEEFNPYSRRHLGNPFPIYTELRESHPVYLNERRGFWTITRYEDVHACLKDWRSFCSGQGITLDGFSGLKPMLILMDPPRHDELRRVMLHAFTPKVIAGMEATVRRIATVLVDDLVARGRAGEEIDLVHDFGAPLPIMVIAEMLGIDPADHAKFRQWSNGIMLANGPDAAELLECYGAIFDYFESIVAERRRDPRDDLVSAILQAEVDGQSLTDDEVLGFCALLLIAGNETTANLLGNIAVILQQNRDVRQQLIDHPELFPTAVEEFLRYDGSVPTLTRTLTRDITLHGQHLSEGQKVLLVTAAANRDPRQFENAERVDIQRDPNPHLGLGVGIHYCMGARLARQEARLGFQILLERMPGYEVTIDKVEYINTPSVRGPVRLPITIG